MLLKFDLKPGFVKYYKLVHFLTRYKTRSPFTKKCGNENEIQIQLESEFQNVNQQLRHLHFFVRFTIGYRTTLFTFFRLFQQRI